MGGAIAYSKLRVSHPCTCRQSALAFVDSGSQEPPRMRLIFINRFFFPDESATSLMLTDLVEGLAELGLPMHVITASASYTGTKDGPAEILPETLTVTRLPNLGISQQSLMGRLLNFVAFYCALMIAGLFQLRRGDLVICLTDPPLVGILATVLARFKGATMIHWVQDIYPETASRLGYGSSSNLAVRIAIRMRDLAWQKAALNVVIGERMRDMLLSHGVHSKQIEVIQNWAGDEDLEPLEPLANPLREEWGFGSETIVIGYSGNLGRAHDAQTMLEAAKLLPSETAASVKLLFIGGGAKHALLASAMADPRLGAVIERRPYRPRSELGQSLNVPDIHWLSLEPELEGLIVPSKFYGAAAVGKPIIFIGDRVGEIARLIGEANCGASFSKGDAGGVAEFIATLVNDPQLRRRLGENARNYCVAELLRSTRFKEWRALIREMQIREAFAVAIAERQTSI